MAALHFQQEFEFSGKKRYHYRLSKFQVLPGRILRFFLLVSMVSFTPPYLNFLGNPLHHLIE